MKRKKPIFITITIVLIIMILSITLGFLFSAKKNGTIEEKFNIYYFSAQSNDIVAEERTITIEEDENKMVSKLLNELKSQPKNTVLTKAIPDRLEILSYNIQGDTLQVNFSHLYNDLKESEELFLRVSLVYTMTELEFIKNVEIFVDGEPLKNFNGEEIGILNREKVVIKPIISPDKINIEKVTLYFSDEMGNALVPEERQIEVKQSESIENQVIEQLIAGPKTENLFATIPLETKIRNIKTESGICYIDLSNDFVSKHNGGSTAENLTIFSIVNSLVELENVNKVQFLIEGEKVNTFKGHLDISKTFEKNTDIIAE